ncbi:DnaJ C-terminal domain-containing protein [Hyphobacterium sp.]|jgi:DnaJ-class molecular chaperone|uniref:DnaJ C-terminal domain-containing protein n=1 Tax=Hyphobacterium sp. TaxID=2004662 RepID=UPI003BACCF30
MSDPYRILGVSKSASADEIRQAYRKLAKTYHPDANPGDAAAEEKFKQISAAFKLLSDKELRARYDRGEIDARGEEVAPHHHFRSARQGQKGEFTDIFSDLFSDFGARPRAARGADIQARLDIDFKLAATGGSHRLNLSDGRRIDVKIPAGVEDGKMLRLTGQGQKGQSGGPDGDLLIMLSIKPHRWLRREGDTVHLDLPVSIQEAVFGAKVRVPTLHGDVDVKIPPNSTSGTLLRLKGRGVRRPGKTAGDQIVRLMVDVPANDDLADRLRTWSPPAGYNPRKNLVI